MEKVLDQFQFERVLSHDPRSKLVHILGRINGEHAIVSFEKARYADTDIPELASRTCQLVDSNHNNIYGWGMGTVKLATADTNIKTIYPATELHIRKYEHQQRHMIIETPDMYKQITLPYIQSLPAERIQWVFNILEGKSEADRVLYRSNDRETGFVVLPDMKWDGTQESLYCVAIAMRSDILSLRSLNRSHLPLLKNIRDTAYQLVKDKYGMDKDLLRLFIHYQPSYYHFHVHLTAMSFADAPGVVAGQAHLLDTVIDNIELYDDYYQRAKLPFTIGERHPLYLAHTSP
ncbi:HIT-like domain-containing protein [Zychaea mexicana]|uniref:HIT-like domain-containing protein n=1 Tax=Zychaea mexicana TaxID=64656 RepID=UPI0022FF2CC2|nr:HIT-like domain-containing protein [Zychaea mexicana]KAI9492628.1 HIT-like domain-containing protein [Zychaea mexicana]